mmetsp:Transcript_44348/g.105070  ORF Transcript_44348/g.105070 Transcript_44348/m.105070 type:complete len:283 (+) Transcript_44348:383-1231(+)
MRVHDSSVQQRLLSDLAVQGNFRLLPRPVDRHLRPLCDCASPRPVAAPRHAVADAAWPAAAAASLRLQHLLRPHRPPAHLPPHVPRAAAHGHAGSAAQRVPRVGSLLFPWHHVRLRSPLPRLSRSGRERPQNRPLRVRVHDDRQRVHSRVHDVHERALARDLSGPSACDRHYLLQRPLLHPAPPCRRHLLGRAPSSRGLPAPLLPPLPGLPPRGQRHGHPLPGGHGTRQHQNLSPRNLDRWQRQGCGLLSRRLHALRIRTHLSCQHGGAVYEHERCLLVCRA